MRNLVAMKHGVCMRPTAPDPVCGVVCVLDSTGKECDSVTLPN
jgi:hypothetical protein